MKKLQETINNRQDTQVFIEAKDFGVFKYIKEKNIYQGQFGYISMEDIAKILAKNEHFNHITIKEKGE